MEKDQITQNISVQGLGQQMETQRRYKQDRNTAHLTNQVLHIHQSIHLDRFDFFCGTEEEDDAI